MAEPPSKRPGDDPADNGGDQPKNPFAGTPFEQILSAMGGASGGQIPDLSVLMQQVQRMFTPYEGSVNWALARDTARATVAQASDPSATQADRDAVVAAVRLADLWLDTACAFGPTGGRAAAWSRAEWVEANASSAEVEGIGLGLRAHQRLVDLIEAGGQAGAEELWRRHLIETRNYLLRPDVTTVLDLMG